MAEHLRDSPGEIVVCHRGGNRAAHVLLAELALLAHYSAVAAVALESLREHSHKGPPNARQKGYHQQQNKQQATKSKSLLHLSSFAHYFPPLRNDRERIPIIKLGMILCATEPIHTPKRVRARGHFNTTSLNHCATESVQGNVAIQEENTEKEDEY